LYVACRVLYIVFNIVPNKNVKKSQHAEVVLSIDSGGALSIRVISLECLLTVGRNKDAHLYFNKAFDKCRVSFILIIMLKIHGCMHHRRVMQDAILWMQKREKD
jgi:hypothetical protein